LIQAATEKIEQSDSNVLKIRKASKPGVEALTFDSEDAKVCRPYGESLLELRAKLLDSGCQLCRPKCFVHIFK